MKRLRLAIFGGLVWLFTAASLALTGMHSEGASWSFIAMAAGVQTAIVLAPLCVAAFLLRKRLRFSMGIMIAGVYVLLALGLLMLGLSGQTSEPLVWEGIAPLYVVLFPLNYFILRTSVEPLSVVSIIVAGGLFYLLLGTVFERFVLLPPTPSLQPRTK